MMIVFGVQPNNNKGTDAMYKNTKLIASATRWMKQIDLELFVQLFQVVRRIVVAVHCFFQTAAHTRVN